MNSQLISRNITVNGRRTSMRLEGASWDAIDDICRVEKMHINELCSAIDQRRRKGSSRTAAVRAFIVSYFRHIAVEAGVISGGHVTHLIPELSRQA